MAIEASDIADIALATYPHLPKLKWQLIAEDLRYYVALPQMFKYAQTIRGSSIQKNLQFTKAGNAVHTGLFDTDTLAMQDDLVQLDTPWRHAKVGWALDERALSMNGSGPLQIVDLMKKEREGAMLQLAEELEAPLFKIPSSTSKTAPHGIPYWVVASATTGFTGGNPSGHTSVGGIDSDTYANFKNYGGTFSDFTKDSLIRELRTAFLKMSYRSPVNARGYDMNVGKRYMYFVTTDMRLRMEELGEDQNENIGKDLAAFDGNIVFRGIPIQDAPQMDVEFSSADRIYMLDLKYFCLYFLQGREMKETKPFKSAKSHNVVESWIDVSYNYQCFDRRRQGVLYKA